MLERALPVHLRYDERDAVLQAERRGLVDAHRPGPRCHWDELSAPLGADGEEAQVEVAGPECTRGGLLDLERTELSPGGPPRGERTDVRVPAVDEALERDASDGAGCAYDTDAELRIDHRAPV